MKKQPTRLCMKTVDVCMIMGYSPRQARNILCDIKVFYKKEKRHPVTIHEFSKYTDLSLDEIEPFIEYNNTQNY